MRVIRLERRAFHLITCHTALAILLSSFIANSSSATPKLTIKRGSSQCLRGQANANLVRAVGVKAAGLKLKKTFLKRNSSGLPQCAPISSSLSNKSFITLKAKVLESR